MSTAERLRFDAMRAPNTQLRFAACRIALRHLLSACLGAAPESFEITGVSGEKPVLLGHKALTFSYCHAETGAAIAIGSGGAPGADLEEPVCGRDLARVARRFFQPEEFEYCKSGPCDLFTTRFLRVWTAKEALLKATGEGLRGLQSLSLHDAEARGMQVKAWALQNGGVLSVAVPLGAVVCPIEHQIW